MSALEVMSKLNPKTQTYTIGTGGKPDIDWQDVCGAIASLPQLAQDLAYLMHNPRTGREKITMMTTLAAIVMSEVEKSGIKCRKVDLLNLCRSIASSALYQVLYPAVCKTRAERMQAGGIVMLEDSYYRRWERFETALVDQLLSMQASIEYHVYEYMRATKRELVNA